MDSGPTHLAIEDPRRGRSWAVPPGSRLVVGRETATFKPDVPVEDKHVSRHHCNLLGESGDALRIVDSSTYGTFLNGVRVEKEALARAGDRIRLGHDYELSVVAVALEGNSTVAWDGTVAEGGPVAAPASGEAPALVGDRYTVVRELGRGGMGAVYEGTDAARDGARCAIKILHAAGRANAELVERFRREAAIGRELDGHAGIVCVYDLGTVGDTGELYCAMPFVDGATLTRFSQGAPLRERVRVVAEVARAVAFAHARGVVHRDLKPENVMVDREGKARLTDFGISKAADESGLTATGTALGTPHYMAPEQLEDAKRAGTPADVYGLGGLLYFALTGRPPHSGKSLTGLLISIRAGQPVPPREHAPGTPPPLEALCLRALALEPRARPGDAATVAEALEQWLVRS